MAAQLLYGVELGPRRCYKGAPSAFSTAMSIF